MAGSLNRAVLIGNLGKDPEIRNTQDGRKIVSFSVATSESWKSKQTGERMERTEWHKVVIFNEGLAGVAEKYLGKGSKVYIEGQLQTRKWTDQSNVERYSTEIVLQNFGGTLVLLDKREGGGGRDDGYQGDHEAGYREPARRASPPPPPRPGADCDPEIPF